MADPMYAVFTEQEKAKIRTHMGYLSAAPVASIALGVPAATQPMFLVEGAMQRILSSAGPIVRDLLCKLDEVEAQIAELGQYAIASEVGDIKLRDDAYETLERLFVRWATKLSDVLGAPLNPYSARFGAGVPGRAINRPVALP